MSDEIRIEYCAPSETWTVEWNGMKKSFDNINDAVEYADGLRFSESKTGSVII